MAAGPNVLRKVFAVPLEFRDRTVCALVVEIVRRGEERRRDLLKQAKAEGEQCRVSIRSIRRESNEYLKKMVKDGLPEDLAKDAEAKVQTLTDSFTAKADKHLEVKEKEIFTV